MITTGKKSLFILPLLIALLALAYFLFFNEVKVTRDLKAAASPLDATYELSGVEVKISKDSTGELRYFGNSANGDLNGDAMVDTAFIFVQASSGSGTFYYTAAAMKTADGFVGTNAQLLGDRVAPQTTEIRDGYLIVNYTDRLPDEPMTAQPSVGVSKYFIIQDFRLIEVSKPADF